MFKKSIVLAVPLIAAGVITSTAGASSTSNSSAADQPPTTAKAAQAAIALVQCDGGATKKVFNRGIANDWVFATDGSATIPGSQSTFNGPSSGKDTVSVAFTARESWVSSNDAGQLKVLLDGNVMKPSDLLNGESYYPSHNFNTPVTMQYCARVGSGAHHVKVVLKTVDGDANGASFYLNRPMLHVEVNN